LSALAIQNLTHAVLFGSFALIQPFRRLS